MRQPYLNQPVAQRPAFLVRFRPSLRQLGAALLLALGLAIGPAQAQTSRPAAGFFQPDGAARTAAAASPLAATLVRSQALTLDEAGLRAALASAPLESEAGVAPLVLRLPQPDGTTGRFALREAPVMEAALAARYPQIKTYAGVGLDDATATVRLDLTPRGFHAQVLSGSGQGFNIAPVSVTDTRHCLSYRRQDVNPAVGPASICTFEATPAQEQATAARVAAWRAAGGASARSPGAGGVANRATGAQLRTYRLALSCIPDYAAAVGNTLASVQAVQATFVNQLTGIFERELAVRFALVANNDRLIFLKGGPPPPFPFVNNFPASMGLVENQKNTDQLIGDANYDLGMLMTMNGGGGTYLGTVCQSGSKAQCSLGFFVPTSNVYVVGLAHEMGHQFGALHSFNNCFGQAVASSSWEPGSGVTLMGYGGSNACPDNEYQSYAERVFHTGSHDEIQSFMSARSCGALRPTGNTPPVVTVPVSGKTLPISTPFQLTATATDANNDPLTYSWEEIDRGPGGPITAPQVTNVTPPLFRTWAPTTSGTRYFPRLAELVNNTTARGEVLPTVSRKLRFRCTARDLHAGTAGVVGGITSSDSVNLRVSAAAGPFVVTAPNAAGLSWAGGSTQTVSWNVANTSAAPVSCAKVNLRLSLDGGLSYPTVLASNVNNSGTASVVVPNTPTATARLMVEAADNYFFDISNANFTITPGPGPVVSSFTPAFGPVGTVVTLTGLNFTGTTAVRFNGTAAASFRAVSATSLTATVAAGSTSGLITVTTPQGTGSSATPFRVGPPPTITSFTPTSGPTGTVVMLTGTNLLGASQVQINGTNAVEFAVVSATQLTLTLADDASTGPLTVSTPFGTATSASPFTVFLRPAIYGYSPAQGPVGTEVTFAGQHFTGATQVQINGRTLTSLTVVSDTQLRARIPAGAITGTFAVTTPTGTGYWVHPPFTVTVVSATANGNATAPGFSVWPNPVGAEAALHVRLAGPAVSARVSLRNGLGQLVGTREFSGSAAELSTAGLASGLYLLSVQADGQAPAVRRVVIE